MDFEIRNLRCEGSIERLLRWEKGSRVLDEGSVDAGEC